MTTSRHWVLDAVESIKNCEAIVSHCNEIMDSIYDEVQKREPGSNDPLCVKYETLYKIKVKSMKLRRKMMSKLQEAYENADPNYRCILKHAINVKGFIDEVDDANHNEFYQECSDAYKIMSLALSQFIWEEPELCARCLLDKQLEDEG